MSGTPVAWLNGVAASDLAHHRGLHYGDGVFRTCLIHDGHVVDLKEQSKKVIGDASRLGLTVADPLPLEREAQQLAAGQTWAVLKILLVRAGNRRGYRSSASVADRLLCRYAAPELPAHAWERGVRVFRTGFRLASQPALAGIKHLNRLEQVLASRAWEEGADEGIVEDPDGAPLAGTRSNLFWVAAGRLMTPALDRCGVEGVMRQKTLAAAVALDLPFRVAPGTWTELERADEVFITNSLIGLWPVAALGAHTWSAPGPLTRMLAERLHHPRLVAA